jgi:hypothetical protein
LLRFRGAPTIARSSRVTVVEDRIPVPIDPGLVLIVALAALSVAVVLFALSQRGIGAIVRRLDALQGPDGMVREAQVSALLKPLDLGERMRAADDQLRALREDVGRLPKPLVASDLAPLLDRLARLEVILGDVRIRIDEQRARTEYTGDDEGGLHGRMRRSLAQRGFEMVHVLADPVEGAAGDELRIPVEARRAGMTYKGTVTVADGQVTDVALRAAHEIFP